MEAWDAIAYPALAKEDTMRMMTRSWVVVFAAALAGCVGSNPIKPTAFAPSNGGLYEPVTLFVNRTVPTPRFYVSRLDAVDAALRRSGEFSSLGPDRDARYILDATLDRLDRGGAADFGGQMVSAATLFLLPSRVRATNRLTVDLYVDGRKVKTYVHAVDYEETLSAFNLSDVGSQEFTAINNVVNLFLAELAADQHIPRRILPMERAPAPAGSDRPGGR